MYNLFSMTKIHQLLTSRNDLGHTEFKLKSIHTSHSYSYIIIMISVM